MVKRIILHWTGGGPSPSQVDLDAYHCLLDQHGKRFFGKHAPEANDNIKDGHYARHAGGFNTGSLGMGLCGMHDAKEHPFDAGKWPITPVQLNEACTWAAELLIGYRLPVTRDTCMLHSEVRPRYGAGIYKWDVNWFPGMLKPGDPIQMGDLFRKHVMQEYAKMGGVRPRPRPKWWFMS